MTRIAPDQEWWTAEEIAASGLPDLPASKRGVNTLAERQNWRADPVFARRRQGRGGGWEYSWKLFPLAAQTRLLKQADPARPEEGLGDRDEAWRWFEELPEAAKTKARERLEVIRKVEALEPTLSRYLAVHQIASLEGIAARTIWNWLGRVEGLRADDRLPHLAPRHRAVKRQVERLAYDPEFFDWLKSDYLRPAGPSFSSCYRRAVRQAQKHGWAWLPERTMRRRFDELVSMPTQELARKGIEALKRLYPAQTRDKTALRAMEVVNADFHKFDVFVRWPGETRPVRPQMVAFQDVYSGRILSWRLDLTANSTAVMLAAGDMIEDWGLPEHVVLDNGREFAAKLITGGTPNRFRGKVREEDIPGLLVALGCQIHWTTPYSGQSKPVERAFRDMCDAIAKDPRFDGAWTGNRPDAKPEDYGRHAVPLEKFLQVVAEGIEEHNLRQGRRSEVAWGRSFAEVFAESYEQSPIRKATEAQRRLWLLGAEGLRAQSRTGLVKFMGNEYWAAWMHDIAGQRVIARFDPADLHAGIHVYGADNAYLGHAPCKLKGGFLSIEDARAHSRARNEWIKAERRALAAHRKLTARELGADLDALPGTETAPIEAKVVRPVFDRRPRPQPAPAPDPALESAQAAVIADLDARRRRDQQPQASETERERFARALELQGRITSGEPLAPEQERWLRMYSSTSEFRAQRMLFEEFGEAYLG